MREERNAAVVSPQDRGNPCAQTGSQAQRKDLEFLISKKSAGQKITMLTCYDHPTAVLEEKAGIDVIFVGDSVGTNALGYRSETEVTMQDMIHHLKAVRRGVNRAYLLVDMPYRTYESPEAALENARLLLSQGADGVKLEGGAEREQVVMALSGNGVDVCAHIGYNPQIHDAKTKAQARTLEQAKDLIKGALILEKAGARLIVFELIPEGIGRLMTEKLSIPTIGIGAGSFCDGQVLVINDLLGITPFNLRHVRKYQNYQELTYQAICRFRQDVENSQFPTKAHSTSVQRGLISRLEEWARADL